MEIASRLFLVDDCHVSCVIDPGASSTSQRVIEGLNLVGTGADAVRLLLCHEVLDLHRMGQDCLEDSRWERDRGAIILHMRLSTLIAAQTLARKLQSVKEHMFSSIPGKPFCVLRSARGGGQFDLPRIILQTARRSFGNVRQVSEWEASPQGERPDTLVLLDLPCSWFDVSPDALNSTSMDSFALERVREAFGHCGGVRNVCLCPSSGKSKSWTGLIRVEDLAGGPFLTSSMDVAVQFETVQGALDTVTWLSGKRLSLSSSAFPPAGSSAGELLLCWDVSRYFSYSSVRERHAAVEEARRAEVSLAHQVLEAFERARDRLGKSATGLLEQCTRLSDAIEEVPRCERDQSLESFGSDCLRDVVKEASARLSDTVEVLFSSKGTGWALEFPGWALKRFATGGGGVAERSDNTVVCSVDGEHVPPDLIERLEDTDKRLDEMRKGVDSLLERLLKEAELDIRDAEEDARRSKSRDVAQLLCSLEDTEERLLLQGEPVDFAVLQQLDIDDRDVITRLSPNEAHQIVSYVHTMTLPAATLGGNGSEEADILDEVMAETSTSVRGQLEAFQEAVERALDSSKHRLEDLEASAAGLCGDLWTEWRAYLRRVDRLSSSIEGGAARKKIPLHLFASRAGLPQSSTSSPFPFVRRRGAIIRDPSSSTAVVAASVSSSSSATATSSSSLDKEEGPGEPVTSEQFRSLVQQAEEEVKGARMVWSKLQERLRGFRRVAVALGASGLMLGDAVRKMRVIGALEPVLAKVLSRLAALSRGGDDEDSIRRTLDVVATLAQTIDAVAMLQSSHGRAASGLLGSWHCDLPGVLSDWSKLSTWIAGPALTSAKTMLSELLVQSSLNRVSAICSKFGSIGEFGSIRRRLEGLKFGSDTVKAQDAMPTVLDNCSLLSDAVSSRWRLQDAVKRFEDGARIMRQACSSASAMWVDTHRQRMCIEAFEISLNEARGVIRDSEQASKDLSDQVLRAIDEGLDMKELEARGERVRVMVRRCLVCSNEVVQKQARARAALDQATALTREQVKMASLRKVTRRCLWETRRSGRWDPTPGRLPPGFHGFMIHRYLGQGGMDVALAKARNLSRQASEARDRLNSVRNKTPSCSRPTWVLAAPSGDVFVFATEIEAVAQRCFFPGSAVSRIVPKQVHGVAVLPTPEQAAVKTSPPDKSSASSSSSSPSLVPLWDAVASALRTEQKASPSPITKSDKLSFLSTKHAAPKDETVSSDEDMELSSGEEPSTLPSFSDQEAMDLSAPLSFVTRKAPARHASRAQSGLGRASAPARRPLKRPAAGEFDPAPKRSGALAAAWAVNAMSED
jgi:hypothetical protein